MKITHSIIIRLPTNIQDAASIPIFKNKLKLWFLERSFYSIVLTVTRSVEDLSFPPGFKFGVASSSYQVEGGWNVSDKTSNIWDELTHSHPEFISDRSTGDEACDSYHLWRRDVEMISELGAHFYRFSISWARLLPKGFATYVSEDGAKYYSDLIDALLEKGIEPVVTIYHWDLPLALQKHGGWINPLISDWFADYARTVFSLYGDRVKTWITINEPVIMCDLAYNGGYLAPGIQDSEVAPYLCNKHVVIAHAKAYRIYDEEFRGKYGGRVSIANQLLWFDPLGEQDEELAEMARMNMARTVYPIFSKEGGWPAKMEKVLEENSRKLGYPRSNLPPFTKEEVEFVKGTHDFFGLNHYTSRLIRPAAPGEQFQPWPLIDCPDLNSKVEYHAPRNKTSSSWLYTYPEGIRKQMVWLKKNFGNLDILITENGVPTYGGLNDQDRIDYYQGYLKQVLLAIKEDGVNVTGYTAWTLMDNFEWMDGYRSKFGLYEVDFSSPLRTRTPRASARFYASVIAKHSLDVPPVGRVPETQRVEAVKIIPANSVDMEPKSSWLSGQGMWITAVALVVAAAVLVGGYVAWRARNRNASAAARDTYAAVKTNTNA